MFYHITMAIRNDHIPSSTRRVSDWRKHATTSTSNQPFFLSLDQDALFFLKDFFSNLASFVNPYLPVDPATEGELPQRMIVYNYLLDISSVVFHT